MSLTGKTLFITGASRGIGLAIALRAARDGANIAIAAKTAEPHRSCPARSTPPPRRSRRPAARRCRSSATCVEEQVLAAVEQTVARFGGIDICVNNACAIQLTGTLQTDMKRYDLMQQINARGTYLTSQRLHPASEARRQPARADAVAAAGHEPAMVRRPHRLHDGEVRHEHVRAGHGRGVRRRRHRLQRAVAAHRHRHRGDPNSRSRGDEGMKPVPHGGDHVRRRPRDLQQAGAGIHRQFPDRRHVSLRRGRARFRQVPRRSRRRP